MLKRFRTWCCRPYDNMNESSLNVPHMRRWYVFGPESMYQYINVSMYEPLILTRLNMSSGSFNKGSPIGAPAHSSVCTLHRPVGLCCSSLQRIWMSTSHAASTLCQCTHVNSPLIPLRSRIFRTVFSAPHPVLLLPYFPPQDGIKSLNFHWTTSIQLNTPKKLETCWRPATTSLFLLLILLQIIHHAWDGIIKWHDDVVIPVVTKAWKKLWLLGTTLITSRNVSSLCNLIGQRLCHSLKK